MRAITNRFILLLGAIFVAQIGLSQVLPAEGRELNYRIVGFSGSEQREGDYTVEIARGKYSDYSSFKKHVIIAQKCSQARAVIEVPDFGAPYTWRIVTKGNGKTAMLHHFSTGKVPYADTAKWRLSVIQKAKKYSDGYVFLDGNRAMYNMAGQPVWYMPDKLNFLNEKDEIRDLKMTPQGTITFLAVDKIYEISYDGDILWRGPNAGVVNGDTSENYHHEFTRLTNGHYMVMGNEFTFWRMDQNGNISMVDKSRLTGDSLMLFKRIQMGDIIEYDEKGKAVWSWHLSDYIQHSDLFLHTRRNGSPDVAIHDNGFYFDEKERAVYLSLRNLSRIIKIKYPEGTLLADYGERFAKGTPEKFDGLFCREHCCRVMTNGNLYLYNNNTCHPPAYPTLIVMKQPVDGKGQLEKVWEYSCTVEDTSFIRVYGAEYTKGGSMAELQGGEFFACMGGTYSKVFIVNKDKAVLWSALPEKWDVKQQKWLPYYSYRADFIPDMAALERLIWKK